ncbi:hypothetical protein H0S56_06255 [Acinetobacter lwoffii]|nr:hypothetical protein H0S56_06255 [Acinetobacter lwoffii]
MKHGTISSYKHYKCRCNDCREAIVEYEKARLQKPKFVYPKPLEHGTSNAYTYHGCRCEICKAFMRGYQMGYIKLNKEAALDDLNDVPMLEKRREHGTAEAYSFGCTCDLCLTKGRNEYLAEIAA